MVITYKLQVKDETLKDGDTVTHVGNGTKVSRRSREGFLTSAINELIDHSLESIIAAIRY